ncbi:MAG: hypothetical protein JWN57_363 [Frankiales bacterium]|nr:hypothetical protein [Frankiales bacterium]
MEVRDVLRLSRGQVALLLLLALLAGGLTAARLSAQPVRYTAQSVVFLPGSDQLTSFAVDPLAASFTNALRLPSVFAAAEQASGVSRSTLSSGVELTHVPGDPTVTITLTAPTADAAVQGSQALGRAGLEALAMRQYKIARDGTVGAREALAVADRRVTALVRTLGVVDLEAALSGLSAELASARAQAPGSRQVRALQEQIDRLVAERPRYLQLAAARDAAQEAVTRNAERQSAAEAQIVYARSEDSVLTGPAGQVSNRSTVVRGVLGAVVVAVLAGLALLMLVEGRRLRQQRAARSVPSLHRQPEDVTRVVAAAGDSRL